MLLPKVEKGRFVNPLPIERLPPPWRAQAPIEEPGFRDFWEWRRNRPKEEKRRPAVPRAATNGALPPAPASGIAATWVGHSSVVLQIDGRTLLCDPVWSDRLAGGLVVPRQTQPGLPWRALPRVDALLVSHDHYDHLDAPTIQRLPRDTPVFCGSKVGSWFGARGFRDVTELGWWDAGKLGGHTITFVPAQHFSGRTPWDRDRTLWGGFVVEGAEGSVAYFAGDSGYFDGFRMIGDAFPRIDLCLMPIGAYLPRWFMSPVHVDPAEAGRAFLDTRARRMMPIHWGTFRLADEAVDDPPRALEAWWREQGIDPAKLTIPPLGERVEILP